jgi:hypothetical protein
MRLHGKAVLLVIAGLLGACTAASLPSGYSGPLAHVTDSVTPRTEKGADYFYVARIDGYPIEESLSVTEGSNRAAGAGEKPVIVGRDVPAAAPSTFTIVATTHYSAALLAFKNPAYELSGDVRFTPLANHTYVVAGVLGETYSAVWIEDSQTGEVAGQKIEVKGAAPLSLLGKLGLQ